MGIIKALTSALKRLLHRNAFNIGLISPIELTAAAAAAAWPTIGVGGEARVADVGGDAADVDDDKVARAAAAVGVGGTISWRWDTKL